MKTRLLIAAFLVSLLALTNGCFLFIGAAAGAGVYAWVDGEVETHVSASLNQTWDATMAALKDLQYPVTTQSKDALEGNLTARNASDTSIKIKLKYVSNTSTEIHIRVGTFGDEKLSSLVLSKIRSHLPGES